MTMTMTMKLEPQKCALAYVAYRRPDAAAVDELLRAVGEELGPPPEGWSDWFFVDRNSIKIGDTWYYELWEALRCARKVVGVLSPDTMPRTREEFDEHGIYLSELFRGQRTGRLLPVCLKGEIIDLPPGLDMVQSNALLGGSSDLAKALAAEISRVAHPREADVFDLRRERWLRICKERGHLDEPARIDEYGPPVILRPVVKDHTDEILIITKTPVHMALRREEVIEVVKEAATFDSFRVPFLDEVQEIISMPLGCSDSLPHSFDLDFDRKGPPFWAINHDGTLISVSACGRNIQLSETAALWLILENE